MSKCEEIKPTEAARRLGFSLDYLYRQLWTGRIAGRKVDGEWKVDRSSVEEYETKRARKAEAFGADFAFARATRFLREMASARAELKTLQRFPNPLSLQVGDGLGQGISPKKRVARAPLRTELGQEEVPSETLVVEKRTKRRPHRRMPRSSGDNNHDGRAGASAEV